MCRPPVAAADLLGMPLPALVALIRLAVAEVVAVPVPTGPALIVKNILKVQRRPAEVVTPILKPNMKIRLLLAREVLTVLGPAAVVIALLPAAHRDPALLLLNSRSNPLLSRSNPPPNLFQIPVLPAAHQAVVARRVLT